QDQRCPLPDGPRRILSFRIQDSGFTFQVLLCVYFRLKADLAVRAVAEELVPALSAAAQEHGLAFGSVEGLARRIADRRAGLHLQRAVLEGRDLQRHDDLPGYAVYC